MYAAKVRAGLGGLKLRSTPSDKVRNVLDEIEPGKQFWINDEHSRGWVRATFTRKGEEPQHGFVWAPDTERVVEPPEPLAPPVRIDPDEGIPGWVYGVGAVALLVIVLFARYWL